MNLNSVWTVTSSLGSVSPVLGRLREDGKGSSAGCQVQEVARDDMLTQSG